MSTWSRGLLQWAVGSQQQRRLFMPKAEVAGPQYICVQTSGFHPGGIPRGISEFKAKLGQRLLTQSAGIYVLTF